MRPEVNDAPPSRRRRQLSPPIAGLPLFAGSRPGLLAGALLGAGVASLILAPDALAGFITPKPGVSPNANEINSLYDIVLYLAAFVFVVVEGALVYSLYRFRARRSPAAAQIHGNTPLEIGWTVAAALILVVITVVTFVKLPSIVNPPNSGSQGLALTASVTEPTPPSGKRLVVCVWGRQFIWRYSYGKGCQSNAFAEKLPYSFTTMVVPVNTTVVLAIQSSDVIHSWWVPRLGGKVDAVPGSTTYTWFKALRTGVFYGQCAQLCGTNHAAMIAFVRVVSPAQYTSWLQQQGRDITADNAQVLSLRNYLTAHNELGG